MSEYRWEGSPEYPQGRAVPLTAEELTQRATDHSDAEIERAATSRTDSALAGLRALLAGLLDDAETAERGWATLTTAQKLDGALRTSLRMNIALARLLLRRLDNP